MSNTPDDWNMHWTKCNICGRKYHLSEGGCGCRDEGECTECKADCTREDWDESGQYFLCKECKEKEE